MFYSIQIATFTCNTLYIKYFNDYIIHAVELHYVTVVCHNNTILVEMSIESTSSSTMNTTCNLCTVYTTELTLPVHVF